VQDGSIESEEKWWGIECEVNRRLALSTLNTETGMAVVFFGVAAAGSKHQCRQATEKEMQRPEGDEITQLCASGVTKEQMCAKH
jgi:hypothetical protein